MKSFTKEVAKSLRAEIDQALEAVGKKYGIEFRTGNCAVGFTEMVYKLEVTPADKSLVEEKDQKDFEYFAHMYKLEKSDFGKEFDYKGTKYTIVGLNLGRPKFVIRGKNAEGKVYFFPHQQVAMKLHPEKKLEILKEMAA